MRAPCRIGGPRGISGALATPIIAHSVYGNPPEAAPRLLRHPPLFALLFDHAASIRYMAFQAFLRAPSRYVLIRSDRRGLPHPALTVRPVAGSVVVWLACPIPAFAGIEHSLRAWVTEVRSGFEVLRVASKRTRRVMWMGLGKVRYVNGMSGDGESVGGDGGA